ncbi:MAG: hypothetical protein PHC46_04425 [Clostridia bacterium]|nr:hypothetical protein [Clostridia bacterium]
MKLKVKLKKLDDELLFKTLDLNVGEKNIQTPFKAGQKKTPAGEICEIYKNFTTERLEKIESDNEEEKKLNSLLRAEYSDAINLCFTNCTPQSTITKKHIETMADLSYPYSDILVTPMWSNIIKNEIGDSVKDKFIKLTNEYIEVLETLNNKSIIGLVPTKIPRQFIDDIIKNYADKGIDHYAINFDGQSIESVPSWFRKLNRTIKEQVSTEKSLLYSINSNEGKFAKKADSISAKDFIGLGYGLDIIGLNHIALKMPSEVWAKMKIQNTPMSYRKFNRETYGYERINETELKRKFNDRDGLKKFNVQEQFKETTTLKDKLNQSNTLETYIKTKKEVREKTIKNIKSIRKETFRK